MPTELFLLSLLRALVEVTAYIMLGQAILFVSDRHGKPAIYWMSVDKLVTETDGS